MSSPSAKRARKEAPKPPAGGEVELDLSSLGVRFHHVQLFADSIAPTEQYKELEGYLNQLAQKGSFDPFSGGMRFLPPGALPERIEQGRQEWEKIVPKGYALPPSEYKPSGQDVVEQMIAGLDWRLSAEYNGTATRSVLLTSKDARGAKLVVTALSGSDDYSAIDAEPYYHFSKEHIDRFYRSHAGRPGVGVLGFEVNEGQIETVAERYRKMHPKLMVHKQPYVYADTRTVVSGGRTEKITLGQMKVLDVFAYYMNGEEGPADQGTVVRFVERYGSYASKPGFGNPNGVLPGLVDVPAQFNGTSVPCYSDHWVSNVRNRDGFLKTLKETVGFTPKVNFNAGVVAAGEAMIESTVSGNQAPTISADKDVVLKDQSQVYLPINNALSEVGHVYGFVEEIGQGVQHLASRAEDLTALIERVNNYRKITGRGFTFLGIPRSYYGFLTAKDLVKAGASAELGTAFFAALQKAKLVNTAGIVDLHITDAQIDAVSVDGALDKELKQKLATLRPVVKRGRYSNMYSLLRDHIDEHKYIQIVENMVLVDIQGQDILYQIFTSSILQRASGDEAPFLEFIQRYCADCHDEKGNPCPIKPGCGGFGIRNFLTLFLSIEVSKAMRKVDEAKASGDEKKGALGQKEVDTLTDQMNESNPVLTDISDAMTEEGEELDKAAAAGSAAERQKHTKLADKFRAQKEAGNEKLKAISDHYKAVMKKLREQQ